jgi:hypothetical protein
MMDHNEFGKNGNRHRSLDGVRKKKQLAIKKFDYTQSQYGNYSVFRYSSRL